jgi:Heme exporter protein D|tara:strand:+ start:375 stop:608 length:234 start_codon:yes stop_codon:yes gene_type:complete
MISEIILMNGYGLYVWSAFSFTLISFITLYYVIKVQMVKEQIKFNNKFASLVIEKTETKKVQEAYKEILSNTSTYKI